MVRGSKTTLGAAFTAALLLLTPAILTAGERVELKSSTTIELPRPRDFEFKRGSTKDIDTPSPSGGGFIAPPPAANSGALEKELRKLQDKRDNWIFMRPEEILMDNKTAAFLKEKDNNSLLEFKGMDKEKNAQEKYFEERQKGNNPESDKEQKLGQNGRREELNRRESDKKQNERSPSTFVFGESNNKTFEGRFPGIGSGVDSFGKNDLGGAIKAPAFMDHNLGALNETRPVGSSFDKDEIKKRAEQRDSDFMKLIQPRSTLPGTTIPGLSGGLDPVNTHIDSTRMDANPITPRQGGAMTVSDRPSFMANDGVPSFRSEISGSGIGDLLPKSPSAPSPFAPSASSPAASQSPISAARPFIFEMPRRAF